MANAAQNAPKFQIGKLSPEDAERLASSFRPAWELDDAPFAPAQAGSHGGLSPAEVDALAAGAGVAPSVRSTLNMQPAAPSFELKTAELHPPKVEIAVDIDVQPDPTPPPAVVIAQAAPQPTKAPSVRPIARPVGPPPQAVKMRDVDSGEFAPAKKSNTGLIIGAVAVLVIGGGIFGVRAVMSSDKTSTQPTSTATTSPTHEETHIPPPPDTATAQQAQVAATQTAAQPTTKAVDPAPVHTNAVANTNTNPTPPVHTTTPAGGGGHTTAPGHTATASGGHGGHTTIVRDNPF